MDRTSTYHVYPTPPPTVNNLSTRQKAQLRRTNTKLTKVLGAAPQVVDDIDISITDSRPFKPIRKLQPSLSVSVSTFQGFRGRRSQSIEKNKDLAPLSSAPRPSSRSRLPAHSYGKSGRARSGSLSSLDSHSNEGKEILSEARTRPQKQSNSRSDHNSRDSLCDTLYEPSFSIPSELKIRREKMARVCKLLGEDVPVDLVFPSPQRYEGEECDYAPVMDICAPEVFSVPAPSPKSLPKPKRKPVPEFLEQPRISARRLPFLETIAEQSPRSSYSSASSIDSASSLLTSTTSSSYRFTSSGCSSYLISSSSHDTVATPQSVTPITESRSPYNRREFSLYVPLREQGYGYSLGCHSEARNSLQDVNVMRGLMDLRA